MIHELGHTIGLFHEQSRPDRDDFVKILWENIKSEHHGEFHKHSRAGIDTHNVSYDYRSIMHYGPKVNTLNKSVSFRFISSKLDVSYSNRN